MGQFRFRLHVAGDMTVSQKARANLQRFCNHHPFAIETIVIDIMLEPSLADDARILATPTLIYEHPARSKRVIGDLSDIDRVVESLGLQQRDDEP